MRVRQLNDEVLKPPLMVTIDVEPDWGCRGTAGICEIVPRLLELFAALNVKATFFVVSDLLSPAMAGPVGIEILKQAAAAGHEIGSHGRTHTILTGLTDSELKNEIGTSRKMLEDTLGLQVRGFRAPFLKGPSNLCAVLEDCGYRYDGSMGTVWPGFGNVSPAKWKPIRQGSIPRLPATTLQGGILPFSLTYLRLLDPLGLKIVDKHAKLLYFHPHEFLTAKPQGRLPLILRWLLKRKNGEPAFEILKRLLTENDWRFTTCWKFLAEKGLVEI